MKKLKNFKNIVVSLFGLLSFLVMIVFTFSKSIVNGMWDQIIFYFCLVINLVCIFCGRLINKRLDWLFLFSAYYMLLGFFIGNHYNIEKYWCWFVFISIIVLVPIAFEIIKCFDSLKNERTDDEENNFKKNKVRVLTFYYLFDLFFLFSFTENIFLMYFFGIITLLYTFYYSTKSFINGDKKYVFLSVQDFLFGIGIAIYLIFSIKDSSLQEIVTSISSAVFGGYLTLLGVGWTIKDNNDKRKEEERLKNIPYIYISHGAPSLILSSFAPVLSEAFKDNSNVARYFTINDFILKNSNNSDCVPCGYYLNNKFYRFDSSFFIERGTIIKVEIAHNYTLNNKENEISLYLVFKDVLNNCYKYECELECKEAYDVMDFESKRRIPRGEYEIVNIKLPELIK